MRHLSLRIDPIIACNLSCLMCYFSDNDYRKNNKGKMEQAQIDRIADIMFPSALQVVLGCATEPTLYKDYVSLIKKAKDKGVPNVSLTTNGQLITREKITELIQAGCDEITLSLHGVYKELYEKFMPGATYEKLHDFLFNLKEEKLRLGSKTPTLRINFTANPENVYELSDFFKVFKEYNISILQVRPVMQIGGVYNTLFINDIDVKAYKDNLSALAENSKKCNVSLLANIGD
ncbi:MAG: radical SAM protein, partial [Methylotenera sp.]|nr:radical SAM protein [Flavobacterium sp.]